MQGATSKISCDKEIDGVEEQGELGSDFHCSCTVTKDAKVKSVATEHNRIPDICDGARRGGVAYQSRISSRCSQSKPTSVSSSESHEE